MEAERGGEEESWLWPRGRGRCRVGEVMRWGWALDLAKRDLRETGSGMRRL